MLTTDTNKNIRLSLVFFIKKKQIIKYNKASMSTAVDSLYTWNKLQLICSLFEKNWSTNKYQKRFS